MNPSHSALEWVRVSLILASSDALRGDHLSRMAYKDFFSSVAMPTANETVLIAEIAELSVFVRSESFSELMHARNSSLMLAQKLVVSLWECMVSVRLNPKVALALAIGSAFATFAVAVAVGGLMRTNNFQCMMVSIGLAVWLATWFVALRIFLTSHCTYH